MTETCPLAYVPGLLGWLGVLVIPLLIWTALIVGVVIAGGRSPRQATRGMQALRVILSLAGGLLVLFCLLDAVRAVRLVYGHDALGAYSQYGAGGQAVMARLLSFFIWHPALMALTSIFLLAPSTRTHPEIVRTATLLIVSTSLPIAIIQYCAVISWSPGVDFRFYVRNLAPFLACVLTAAVWFGIKVGLALWHKRDARAWTIGGLIVFHLACVCTYTFMLWVLTARMAAGGMGQ
jgi:hypothetical protein